MALKSMTGFARADGSSDHSRWTWEIRSVNGKGLDLRFRLPPGYERLDPPARERCAARLARGNIQATLNLETGSAGGRFRINEAVLADVVAAMKRIAATLDVQPPTLDGILALRGIVETAEEEDEACSRRPRWPDPREPRPGPGRPCGDAHARGRCPRHRARRAPRRDRAADPSRRGVARPRSPRRSVRALPSRSPRSSTPRLRSIPTGCTRKPRCSPPAPTSARRSTASTPISRPRAISWRATSRSGAGSTFLAQEFNREVNTLCAKANDVALTAIGLELKAVVDQFREQIQNLE